MHGGWTAAHEAGNEALPTSVAAEMRARDSRTARISFPGVYDMEGTARRPDFRALRLGAAGTAGRKRSPGSRKQQRLDVDIICRTSAYSLGGLPYASARKEKHYFTPSKLDRIEEEAGGRCLNSVATKSLQIRGGGGHQYAAISYCKYGLTIYNTCT